MMFCFHRKRLNESRRFLASDWAKWSIRVAVGLPFFVREDVGGVQADDFAWRRIRALARTEVRSVEELPRFLRSTEARARGERP